MPGQAQIIRTVTFFWLIAKLISYKVWLADRLYPVVPVFDFTNYLPGHFHTILFCSSILLLIYLLVLPKNNFAVILLIFTELLSCLLDVTRWQPWEYLYLFLFAIIAAYGKNKERLYIALTLVFASTYIFSGLHKLNGGFLYSVWKVTILHEFFGIPHEAGKNLLVHYSGLLLPVLETATGLGILLLKNKRLPVYILIAMHLFILVLVGPFGTDYNVVIWPWNVAMIFLLYIMFIKNNHGYFNAKAVFNSRFAIIILFWIVLPVASFSGYWSRYFSSSLYSGNTLNMDICFGVGEVPKEIDDFRAKRDKHNICDGKARLSILHWGLEELKVPPYPETWYYNRFKQEYEKKYSTGDAAFIMYAYPYRQKQLAE